MSSLALRKDEGLGLGVAVALHAGLLALLVLRPPSHEVVKPPQRIEVTISDEVGLTSTSPDPFSQAAPDYAPTLGEAAPQEAEPLPEPLPVAPNPPQAVEPPAPRVLEQPRPEPKPVPKPVPKPAPKATTRPTPPAPKPSAKPKTPPKPAAKATSKPSTSRRTSAIDSIVSQPAAKSASASTAATAPKKAGGTRLGANFLDGVSGSTAQQGSGAPAAEIGAKQRSALGAAINRQLKPHWQAPQGADAELLVTRVRFRLNRDGSLAGEPQVLSTSGQTPSNEAQVSRHQEQAVRAVKLAAPFNLPDDLYDAWKVVTTNFDRRLSQ